MNDLYGWPGNLMWIMLRQEEGPWVPDASELASFEAALGDDRHDDFDPARYGE